MPVRREWAAPPSEEFCFVNRVVRRRRQPDVLGAVTEKTDDFDLQ